MMRLFFWFGTLVLTAGFVGSSQSNLVPEDAPAGLKLLDSAATLQALTQKAHADIAWQDADGAALFLWSEPSSTPDRWAFRLNRAYYIRQNGKVVWAFLDDSSSQNLSFVDPVTQFLLQRHHLQPVASGARIGDGNSSLVELMDRDKDGSIVLKLVYASNSGERAEQEEVRTYLLYKSSTGTWQLATHDLSSVLGGGNSRNGWIAIDKTQQFHIIFMSGGPAPFRVELKNFTSLSQGNSCNVCIPDYTTFREGTLTGEFPLQLQMSNQDILSLSGTETLQHLAQTIMAYQSEWVNAGWVTSPVEARGQVESLWVEALQRANPGFGADQTILPNMQFIIPNDASRAIFDQLANRFGFGK